MSQVETRTTRRCLSSTASRSRAAATGLTCRREHSTSVRRFNARCARSRRANPNTLYGIFGDVQWSNKDRLPDRLLVDLIDHFCWHEPVATRSVPNDVLGDAYEYLIKKFADLTNKKAGEFYTPRSVVRLMVNILDPKTGETVYDPACGTGGMLLETLHHVRDAGGDDRLMLGKLYGQEKNLTTAAIARMNLFLHGAEDFSVIRGDTLREPAFFSGDRLATFDCVIANPPFSLEAWGEDAVGERPLRPQHRRHTAPQVRRLGMGSAHDHFDGPQDRPPRRRAPARCDLPHGRRGQDPLQGARPGPDRGRHRTRPEPVLRHRPCRVHPGGPSDASRRTARARSCSSTARNCSAAAATRTPSSPNTSRNC